MGKYRAETEKTAPDTPNILEQGNQESLEDTNESEDESKRAKGKARKIRKMKICAGITFVTLLVIGLSSACLFRNPTIFTYPLHASCNITWTFSSDCNYVAEALVRQIEGWGTNETCGTGQKCLYKLNSVEGNVLKATHTTPVKHYIDDLRYSFYPNSATEGCTVVGFSNSQIWYAVLDYGTNYCNLHNLVEGAGLMQDTLYTELTRNEICTQYTSANCDKY